jgi:hypothetical protein
MAATEEIGIKLVAQLLVIMLAAVAGAAAKLLTQIPMERLMLVAATLHGVFRAALLAQMLVALAGLVALDAAAVAVGQT